MLNALDLLHLKKKKKQICFFIFLALLKHMELDGNYVYYEQCTVCSKGLHGVTHFMFIATLKSREHYYLSWTDGRSGSQERTRQ